MDSPKHVWMVRAGDDNELADQVWQENAVAIGWDAMGDLSGLSTREQFKDHYRQTYPDHSEGRVAVNAGQIYRFVREIAQGDYVLSYIKESREILIGVVAGPYTYKPDGGGFPERYPHAHPVQWLKRVSRDSFGAPARNSMGSALTVFSLDEHLDKFHAKATASAEQEPDQVEPTPPFFEDVKARADELISDLISRLDPYDFQDLVAGLLRAMGFKAVSVPRGPDRGIDIIAHPDSFGFERPRIKVQVKHRKGSVSGPEMRSFLGALRSGDSGLYASTGGFTSGAQHEAERSREPVTLLDRDGFINLLLENYEALDAEFKAKVPLRKVWLPVE